MHVSVLTTLGQKPLTAGGCWGLGRGGSLPIALRIILIYIFWSLGRWLFKKLTNG
eukprot:jgi/Botrbrau1/15700/Bobra.4_1s0073.1